MAIFENIAQAAKDFFVDSEEGNTANAQTTAAPQQPLPGNSAPTFQVPTAAPVLAAEQRHLDHIASLLAGDNKDFGAYLKMVKSMAAAGMSGPLLYQTAYNAFSAVNGGTVPALLASAAQFEQALVADRNKVEARHREKMGETPAANPGPIAQLASQEKQLAADLASLGQQLQAKQQELLLTQQKLAEERQKTQAALSSYELANSAAMADLQAHRRAAETFLSVTGK